jgi:arginyl-tRNA synthetase
VLFRSHFEELYELLGTKFDYYFFESESAEPAKRIISEYKAKKVFVESEGAVIFRGEEHGLHTRVFLNKAGLPTYEAKELALAKMKHDSYPYDFSMVVTANEITEYFKVLLKAMHFVFPDLAAKTRHVGHGMMRFVEAKMSSRKGNIITGESLINDSIELAMAKIKEQNFGDEQKLAIARSVGLSALRYSILKQQLGRDIIYDPERSFSLDGDSGPYLQYAYVRAYSVLKKAEEAGIDFAIPHQHPYAAFGHLERLLSRYGEVVDRAGREFAPHFLVTFLTELAAEFNSYYSAQKIIDSNDPASPYRVAIVKAVAIVLKDGLDILGIVAPERM